MFSDSFKFAEAYIGKGDADSAISALEDGYEKTQSEEIKAKLDELKSEDTESSDESLQSEATELESSAFKNSAENSTNTTSTPNNSNSSKLRCGITAIFYFA